MPGSLCAITEAQYRAGLQEMQESENRASKACATVLHVVCATTLLHRTKAVVVTVGENSEGESK